MIDDKENSQVRTTELIHTGRSWDGAELPDMFYLSQPGMPLSVQHPELRVKN